MNIRRPLTTLGFVCLLLAWFVPTAQAQADLQFRGYVKNLAIYSQSPSTDDPYYLDLSRLRTRGLLDLGRKFHGEVWLDTEVLVGSFLSTEAYEQSKDLERTTFLDLNWKVAEGDDFRLQQAIFRGYGTAYLGQNHLTVGRQRIAWGTGFAWNPTDLFNPFNPGAIELGEKEGVDAVYLLAPIGLVSRLEVAAAPGKKKGESMMGFRGGTNYKEYDVSVMGGRFRDTWVVGGDFAGYVGDAGLRGELTFTTIDKGKEYLRAVVNMDYSFAGGYYALVEYHYNGLGQSDKSKYDCEASRCLETFSLARDYLAASVSTSPTPLLGVMVYSLLNLDDQSGLLGPSFSYSLAENFELTASAYLFVGASDSEYGSQHHVAFASLQYFF